MGYARSGQFQVAMLGLAQGALDAQNAINGGMTNIESYHTLNKLVKMDLLNHGDVLPNLVHVESMSHLETEINYVQGNLGHQ